MKLSYLRVFKIQFPHLSHQEGSSVGAGTQFCSQLYAHRSVQCLTQSRAPFIKYFQSVVYVLVYLLQFIVWEPVVH